MHGVSHHAEATISRSSDLTRHGPTVQISLSVHITVSFPWRAWKSTIPHNGNSPVTGHRYLPQCSSEINWHNSKPLSPYQ